MSLPTRQVLADGDPAPALAHVLDATQRAGVDEGPALRILTRLAGRLAFCDMARSGCVLGRALARGRRPPYGRRDNVHHAPTDGGRSPTARRPRRARGGTAVIPYGFDYAAPGSPAEVIEILARDPGRTRLLSGGTWLVPDMNRGLERPGLVLDLRAAGLRGVEIVGSTLRLGATCTYGDLMRSDAVVEHAPLLAFMAQGITGGVQLTDQGTVGGSAAAGRVGSDVPGALTAADATVLVLGPDGERRVPTPEFWLDVGETALAPDEVLLGFEIPAIGDRGWAYEKVKRSYGSWPILVAGAVIERDVDGQVAVARLAVGGGAPTPVVVDVADLLTDGPTPAACAEAGRRARAAIEAPWSDELAPASYRSRIVAPVAARVLARAAQYVPSAFEETA
jgi:carbon-monoxide dehydrogenase medium subunit